MTYTVLVSLIVLGLVSCGRSDSPAAPPVNEFTTHESEIYGSNHNLLGYYLISIEPGDTHPEIIPVRELTDHWNVLSFLEQWPCTECLKITGVDISPDGNMLFDVRIDHPFPGTNFTGFDVRGIVMFNGSRLFNESGLLASDSTQGDGELINAEGFTTLYNPYTWGSGPGGMQGYIPGKMSSSTFPNATLNGYLRHITDDPTNTRNAFYAGDTITRTYEIKMPTGGSGFLIGYAIDVSWVPPTNVPVIDPMTDFPISANCTEPWNIDVSGPQISDGLTNHGGYVNLTIDVYDWQGSTTHHEPVIECQELFSGIKTAEFVTDGPGYSRWEISFDNENLPPVGRYKCLVSVEDKANADSPSYLDLTAYQMVNLDVVDGGWALSWGGAYMDFANDVAIAGDGTILVTGHFYNTPDFDPSEDILEHTSVGYEDAYLSSFDPDGNLLGVKVWGGNWHESGDGLAVDNFGNVYVVGYFNETVDFNPGSGVDEHVANGDWDSYLMKFSSNGAFEWAKTWGSSYWDKALSVAADSSGGVYVVGFFRGNCDFDPGPEIDDRDFVPGAGYLSKFDSSGDHQWVHAWAGDGDYGDVARDVAVDELNNVFVVGEFDGTCDLDPTGGVDIHTTPSIYSDTYLSCFTFDGDFQWTNVWGGIYDDASLGIAADNNGNVYAVGYFLDSVDFKPGPGLEEYTAQSGRDAYITKFSTAGDHQWTRVWGSGNGPGGDNDMAYGISIDSDGNPHVSGTFCHSVDFDPGPDVTEYTSNGMEDMFVSVFTPDGEYLWARASGSEIRDYGRKNTVDSDGNSYFAGSFQDTVDFNPYEYVYNLTSSGSNEAFLVKYLPYGHW